MNALAKEFDRWIVRNGYGTLAGQTGGGHLRYRLRNNQYFTTSSTPSKYSAITNGKADVRRALGIASESPRAGKYRHKPSSGYDGANEKAEYGMPPEVARLRAAVKALDAQILSLHPRTHATRLRVLAERRIHLSDQLDRLGVPVPMPGIPRGALA